MPVSTWWRIATGKSKGQKRTLEKLTRVVMGQLSNRPAPKLFNMVVPTYRGYVVALCNQLGADPELVLASDPGLRANADAAWAAAAKIRAMAVYCTVTELNLPAAQVAKAIGVTRQAASEMLKRVEDLRDDVKIDAMLERTGPLISGRAA